MTSVSIGDLLLRSPLEQILCRKGVEFNGFIREGEIVREREEKRREEREREGERERERERE